MEKQLHLYLYMDVITHPCPYFETEFIKTESMNITCNDNGSILSIIGVARNAFRRVEMGLLIILFTFTVLHLFTRKHIRNTDISNWLVSYNDFKTGLLLMR